MGSRKGCELETLDFKKPSFKNCNSHISSVLFTFTKIRYAGRHASQVIAP